MRPKAEREREKERKRERERIQAGRYIVQAPVRMVHTALQAILVYLFFPSIRKLDILAK
jgi:hypothetical protein